jgi:hypothetical protein
MTPDLRPDALLALADELEEQHTFSAFWSAVDDAVATLRALAAQPAWQAGFEEGRKRERAMWPPESDWAMYLRNSAKSVEEDRANYVYLLPRECRAIADALAAPSQPMAGEP